MTDRELLDLIAAQVSVLTTQGDSLVKDVAEVKATMATKDELAKVKDDLDFVKGTVVKIEIEHGQSLGALLDGHNLNAEKLDRIEKEVTKHEEIILRKVL